MNKLSHTLGELYELAADAPLAHSVEGLLLAIRELVPFSGAAMGEASGPPPFGLLPPAAHTVGMPAALVEGLALLAAVDPVARDFHANGMVIQQIDCALAYAGAAAHPLHVLAAHHDIGFLLMTGNTAGRYHACWMVLVRSVGEPFSDTDLGYLNASWPHLVRCLHSLHRRVLATLAQAHGPGVALLHPDGTVIVADSQFAALCLAEWNIGGTSLLPDNASTVLVQNGEFSGRTLRLHSFQEDGFIACCAWERTSCELLTRAERVVAFRYANGESYKEIAHGLAVSENTVRTHLAHVYDKLGIHRKVELIHQIGRLH